MDATNAAGGKEAQSRHMSTQHRTGYRRCPQLTGCQCKCQVTPAHLLHMLRCSQSRNLVQCQANFDFTIVYAYSSRNGPLRANRSFHSLCYLDVRRVRQTMSNYRRFERDKRALFL